MILDISTDEIVQFTNKLERMHRSALPNAVRSTLNEAAFAMKGVKGKEGLVKKYGDATFDERTKNFTSIMTRVDKAKGWEIDKMQSNAGIAKLPNKDKAAEGLATQESGGTMKAERPFFPMDTARKGANKNATIAEKNKLRAIQGAIKVEGNGDKQALYKAAFSASYIIYEKQKTTLFKVLSVGRGKIELMPLYRYIKGFKAKVNEHAFIQPASQEAGTNLNKYFIEAANREFNKIRK